MYAYKPKTSKSSKKSEARSKVATSMLRNYVNENKTSIWGIPRPTPH